MKAMEGSAKTAPGVEKACEAAARRAYHHGDLREALIEAAHRLIVEKGPEGFSLAEACRLAGVSTAAPYRHFADRAALIFAVAERGFCLFQEQTRTARDRYPLGSVEGIVAMGQAYVAFAASEPEIFKLMFGAHPAVQRQGEAETAGNSCFGVVLEAVEAWMRRQGRNEVGEAEVLEVALPLWSLVHGTSYLLLDRAFERVAPGTDVNAQIERTTFAYLNGLAAAMRGA